MTGPLFLIAIHLTAKNRTARMGRPIPILKEFPYSVNPILSMSALVSGLWPRNRT